MRTKICRAVLAVVVAGAAAAGCTAREQPTPPPSAPPSQVVTVWADAARADALTALAPELATRHDVRLQVRERDVDGTAAALLADPAQAPDLLLVGDQELRELVAAEAVLALDLEDLEADLVPAAVGAMTVAEQTYAVPHAIENLALLRNDTLSDAQPDTWAELVDQEGAAAVLVPLGELGSPYHLYPFQSSFGAQLRTSTAAGGAFARWLAANGPGGTGLLQPGRDASASVAAFEAEQAPFLVAGSWQVASLLEAGMELSVLPIPDAGDRPAAGFVTAQGFAVNAASDQADLARSVVLETLASPVGQQALFNASGAIPASPTTAEVIGDPVVSGFVAAAEHGTPLPSWPQEVWNLWGATEVDLLTGSASDPDAAWESLVTAVQDLDGSPIR